MKKNKKTEIVIKVAIIASIMLIVFSLIFFLKVDENNFLSVNYYDANGNLIKQPSHNSLAITNVPFSPKFAYFMSITIKVNNNGSQVLSCQPVSSSPSELTSTLPTTIKPARQGQTVEWTSNLINISQFIGRSQPIRFNVTVKCSYPLTPTSYAYISQSGYADLNIHGVCGDGICEADESIDSCGQDCVPKDKMIFRTANTNYPYSYSEIAFSNVCGSNVTRYSFGAPSSGLQKVCTSSTVTNCPQTLGDNYLILNTTAGYPSWANKPGCIYQSNTYSNQIYIMWKGVNTKFCPMTGVWGGISYIQNDSAIIDNSSDYHYTSNEVFCK